MTALASTFRVGLLQLTSHPAVRIGDVDYLREPIAPDKKTPSITVLSRTLRGLSDAQDRIRQHYVEWQRARLTAVLQSIEKAPPDLLLLPECGVPPECLSEFAALSARTPLFTLAGTHSPLCNTQAKHLYAQASISSRQYDDVLVHAAEQGQSVLVVCKPGHTDVYAKAYPSVFEQASQHSLGQSSAIAARTLTLGRLPLMSVYVCSEALAPRTGPDASGSICVILAYEASPERYEPRVRETIDSGRIAIVVNDGLFGGSGVFGLVDDRMEHWWYEPPIYGRLATGDYYAEFEIDPGVRSVEKGVSSPRRQVQLVRLAVVYPRGDSLISLEEEMRASASVRNVALLDHVFDKLSRAGASPTTLARWAWISSVIRSGGALPAPYVEGIGASIAAGECSLASLETELCSVAVMGLERELSSAAIDHAAATDVGSVYLALKRFRRAAGREHDRSSSVAKPFNSTLQLVNQHELQGFVRDFALRGSEVVLIVTGLVASGKSAVIETGLSAAAARGVRVRCEAGTSAQGLARRILAGCGISAPDENAVTPAALAGALRAMDVLWIESLDHLWDDDAQTGPELTAFWSLLEQALSLVPRAKVLVESRRWPELSPGLLGRVARRRIQPFSAEDALAFFEASLVRVGVSLAESTIHQRQTLAKAVERHAGLLLLAAEACAKQSVADIGRDLRHRRGFFLNAVRYLLEQVALTSDEGHLLTWLAEARVALDPAVFTDGSAERIAALTALIGKGLVRTGDEGVEILGVLRGASTEWTGTAAPLDVRNFHLRAMRYFVERAAVAAPLPRLLSMIEANYHATEAGQSLPFALQSAFEGLIGAAQRAYDKEDYARTVTILAPVIDERGVRGDRASAMYVDALAWSGNVDEALYLAETVVTYDRALGWLFYEIARAALHERNTRTAHIATARGVELRGANSESEVLFGRIAASEGNLASAEERFIAAVEKARPGDAWPHFYLARHYVRQGLPSKGKRMAKVGRDRAANARGRLGRRVELALMSVILYCHAALGDEDGMRGLIKHLDRRRGLQPEGIVSLAYCTAHVLVAKTPLLALQAFEEAVARLAQRETSQRHTRAQIHMFRGKLFLELSKPAEAIQELENALALDATNGHMRSVLRRAIEDRLPLVDTPVRISLQRRLEELTGGPNRVDSSDGG